MSYQHAVVWMDHREAKVIDFTFDEQHAHAIVNEHAPRHVHNKKGPGHDAHDHEFFDAIVHQLGSAGLVLLVGPGASKGELKKYLEAKHPKDAARIVGVETMDHPTPGELLKHARAYFKRYDQLNG